MTEKPQRTAPELMNAVADRAHAIAKEFKLLQQDVGLLSGRTIAELLGVMSAEEASRLLRTNMEMDAMQTKICQLAILATLIKTDSYKAEHYEAYPANVEMSVDQ